MGAEEAPPEKAPSRRPPRRPGRAAFIVLAWIIAILAFLAALVAIAALYLDSGPGHRFLARRIAGLKFDGLSLRVGRIEGSIWGRLVLEDVALRDDKGVAARSPRIVIDWRPGALAHRQILVEAASADLVNLVRKPDIKPSKTKSRMPSLDYAVRRLSVADLALGPALTGQRRDVFVLASADIRRGRVRLDLDAQALATKRASGGDVARVRLEADPKANRLALALHIAGPAGGVIDRLLKLGAPVEFDLAGRGDWRGWRGRAAGAVGAKRLIDAQLFEASGAFSAAGTARPGVVFKSLAPLASPSLRFDLGLSFKGPQIGLNAWLASNALQAKATGALDRKKRVFEAVRVQASLTDLSALSRKLSGKDARLSFFVDGPLARPLIDYDFSASSLGWGAVTARNVQAHGRSARIAAGGVEIPISLTAASVAGFSKTAGPLTNAALRGTVNVRTNGALSASLQLRADHLSLLVDLTGSERSKSWSGTLSGRADAAAVSRLGLGGALGGPVLLSARFASSPAVTLRLFDLEARSPKLRLTAGEASLAPGGGVVGRAMVAYADYGLAQVSIGGRLDALRAHVSAASVKRPIPLIGLQVDIAKAPGGWRLSGSARSTYGTLAFDAVVETSKGGLSIALSRAQLAGLSLVGDLTRTAAGPFVGRLALAGDGFSGTLTLSAEGRAQSAALVATARNARLPLSPPIAIASGEVETSAILRPGAPDFTGRLRLEGVERSGLALGSLDASFTWRDRAGQANLSLAGQSGAPFRFAGKADFTSERVRLSGAGEIAHVKMAIAAPAEATRLGGVWRLAPVTVLTSGGRVILAGSADGGVNLSAKLQSLDLRLIRAIRPGLTLGGRVSGDLALQIPKEGSPAGQAELQIAGLSEMGETTISSPVDVNLIGRLAGAGGVLDADFRQSGAVIGRLQARLSWPAAGPYSARLKAARVEGGIRYNGPAQALVGLAGLEGQEVVGPIAIGADVSGPLRNPAISGVVRAKGLEYQNARIGTRVAGIDIEGAFHGTRFTLQSLTASTNGGGKISASGYADLSAAAGWPMRLTLTLAGAQIAQSDQLGAKLSGTLTVSNSRQAGGLISGDLTLDRATYRAGRGGGEAETAELRGVHWKGQPVPAAKETAGALPSRWKLAIEIHAPDHVLVSGMGLESDWRADLTVSGTSSAPRIIGDATSIRGTFSFAGRRLTLEDSVIHFDGSSPPNPTLDVVADVTVSSVTATVTVTGTAERPQIAFTSSPAMPEDEVLSSLLFGGSSPQLSSLQALQLAASLNALRGGGGGLGLLGKLSRAAGVQNL
ncbi:MAG: translocation/assembly module TamB domain-containing protein, partial [Caulobacteraceae bacterium]